VRRHLPLPKKIDNLAATHLTISQRFDFHNM
jgi:hypothetical protein